MAELDTANGLGAFEARFAVAYRQYLHEVPADVDAAEVARSVVARPRSRWQLRPWTPGRMPALAWALVLTGLLAAMVVGALLAGARPPDPAPAGLLAQAFVGGWSSAPQAPQPKVVILHACAIGDTCGIVWLSEPSPPTGYCEHDLVLRSGTLNEASLEVLPGAAVGCEEGFWPGKQLRLTTAEPGGIGMLLTDGRTEWYNSRLHRFVGSVAPDAMAGTWEPVTDGSSTTTSTITALTLERCAVGVTCGTLRAISSPDTCDYAVTFRERSPDGVVFDIGRGRTAACAWYGLSGSMMDVTLTEDDALRLTGVAAGQVWLRRAGSSATPAPAVDQAPDPAGDLPAGTTGTWLEVPSSSARMITLSECSVDEVCGHFVVDEPSATCEYSLTLRSRDADSAEFELGQTSTWACGYSPLPGSRREVRRKDDGTIELYFPEGGGGSLWVPFQRGDLATLLAHPEAVPPIDWVNDTTGEAAGADIVRARTRLTLDHLVLQVELAETPPDDVPWSLTAWLNTDRTGSCNPWVSAYMVKVSDIRGSRAREARLGYVPQTFGSSWFGTPGRTEPASYDLAYAIDGPRITIVIPLEQLAHPQTLGFRLHTFAFNPSAPDDPAAVDELPSTEIGDLCREVALTWE